MAQIIQEKMYLNNKKLIDIMNIKIEHKNKVGLLPTSHWIDPKKLKNYTLPTFTKRIVRYLESNK